MDKLEVFYDGACPLCRREISMMERMDRHRRLAFTDISAPDAAESCPIDQQELLARFHVRTPEGRLVSGARAFTAAYAQLTGVRFIEKLGTFGPSRAVLDRLYTLFLKVRPALQRLAGSDRRDPEKL
jgi:predicted DCC family thiol-disulfide oxidoreductase YuxK